MATAARSSSITRGSTSSGSATARMTRASTACAAYGPSTKATRTHGTGGRSARASATGRASSTTWATCSSAGRRARGSRTSSAARLCRRYARRSNARRPATDGSGWKRWWAPRFLDGFQLVGYGSGTFQFGALRVPGRSGEDEYMADRTMNRGTASGGSSSGTPASPGLFTRQSSGLVRELGIPAATGIALASVAVVNTFINFYSGLFNFTQVDMVLPLLLAAGIWLVAMFAYRYLLQAIPRAGGEYIYLSRIIHPAIGTMVGIATAVGFTYTLSANANFAAAYVPFALNSLGAAFNSSALTSAATSIANTTSCGQVTCSPGLAICAVAVLVIVGLGSIFSLRRIAQIILGLVIFQVLAFLVLGFLFATHSHQDFVNALGSFSGHATAYNDVIALAQKDNLALGVDIGASILVVPFMVLNYNGVLYSYYVGGELKRPGRTYIWASVISIALLIVVWVGVWLLMRSTIGLDFMQAQAQVGTTDASNYGNITSLQANAGGLGYGLVLSGDPITKIFIGLAVPAAELAVDLAD